MRRLAVFAVIAACLLPGCRRGLDKDSDPDVGGKALQTALEAWKSGRAPEELEARTPSILMNEDDWRTGKQLLDFKVEESSLAGRQVRARVRITLREGGGRPWERKATYIIDTTPRIVIVRDLFQ